ncbi:MAG: MBL fold metallo-hydrolase [Acidiferrobacterales bacterium]
MRTIEHEHGITTIDADYGRPGVAAIHLLIERGRAAILDTGTVHSADALMATLADRSIRPRDVEFVIVTHVHLDHAGGAGELMRRLPDARLVVHPRGARHLIDPEKLVAGVITVYGAEETNRRFGQIMPIAADRILEAPDGLRLQLGGRELLCLDTPGHARHHICVFDRKSNSFFTGDTFGLSYREFDTEQGAFIFPTTTPVQFDPEALHGSIDRLIAMNPHQMFLTHFGRVGYPHRLARHLHACIDAFTSVARQEANTGAQRHSRIRDGLTRVLLDRLSGHGCRLDRERVLALLEMDIELNAQGLAVWLDGGNTR